MGNQHTHGATKHMGAEPLSHSGSKKERGLSRTASGTDIQDRSSTQLLPVEKLAKRYVFPRYPVLAEKLFEHMHTNSKAKTSYLGCTAFRQQCERFMAIMDDDTILNMYVRMYSEHNGGCNGDMMTPDSLRLLLLTAYRVAMDHYAEGPQMCLHIQKTLTAVVTSCFHNKTRLSAQFVSHWLSAHCPRLILPLHRYTVHSLATAYRALETDGIPQAQGLDLATPVLEQPNPFGREPPNTTHLLPMSVAWLLAGALPPLYSRPQNAATANSNNYGHNHGHNGHNHGNNHGYSGVVGLSSQAAFLAKLVSAVPSHWVLLYNSDLHGQGANRFLHHVLAYRGATLVLLRADCGSVFCVASPNEWHETHLYWGGEDAALVQLLPKFQLIEKGAKMLYLNTTIRGYPHGLRVGKDPRKPIVIVDGGFEKIEFHNIPYTLTNIEVWGCGDQSQRETQLDIKKWQVKEAERQRDVKLSAADWLDHPDRYLLELAGRPQYNNSQNNGQPIT